MSDLAHQPETGTGALLRAYLSVAVLLGLGANALVGLRWADPLSALLVALVCLRARFDTWRGRSCRPDIIG